MSNNQSATSIINSNHVKPLQDKATLASLDTLNKKQEFSFEAYKS